MFVPIANRQAALRSVRAVEPSGQESQSHLHLVDTVIDLDHRQVVYPLRQPRVSVVIPTYNEARNLPHVFAQLPADLYEVIVVDGRSTDDTLQVARALRPDVRIVLQNRRGKGNAMACGFAAVRGDIIVMLDADGSADPREIASFVRVLIEGADFAKGTRFVPGGGSTDITPTRRWGNRMLNRVANLLFKTRYTDLCYGYNAFWTHCLPALGLDVTGGSCDEQLWGDGFEIETLINTRMAKAGMRTVEVPSFESDRLHGESNLNTWRDGLRVLRALLQERVTVLGGAGATGHRIGAAHQPEAYVDLTAEPSPALPPLPAQRQPGHEKPQVTVRASRPHSALSV